MGIDREQLANEIGDFRELFCPFGYLDIERAVSEAMEIGENARWAFEEIERFMDDCGVKLSDVDPCYVVMDSILQQARNEIDQLTGFDVMNDADFYTAGNYCATTYDWKGGDVEALTEKLREHYDALDNLSDATVYWLAQVEILVEDILPPMDEEED